jgi:hypothetical protein
LFLVKSTETFADDRDVYDPGGIKGQGLGVTVLPYIDQQGSCLHILANIGDADFRIMSIPRLSG